MVGRGLLALLVSGLVDEAIVCNSRLRWAVDKTCDACTIFTSRCGLVLHHVGFRGALTAKHHSRIGDSQSMRLCVGGSLASTYAYASHLHEFNVLGRRGDLCRNDSRVCR